MKKRLKMYLHHSHYEAVAFQKRSGFFGMIQLLFYGFRNVLVAICYLVGYAVITVLTIPVTAYHGMRMTPKNLIKFNKKIRTKQFQQTIAAFTLLVVLAGSSIHGLHLLAAGQSIKGQVLGASDVGIGYLQDAKISLDAQNTEAAQANFTKALEQFRNSEQTLNSTSITLRSLLAVVPQKHDADRLLNAAQHITKAAIKGTQLIELTNNMKLSAIGLSGGTENRTLLLQAQTLLNESVELANIAAAEISAVNISSIPKQYQPTFVAAKDMATLFQNNAQSLKEVCSLLFDIVLGQKNVLLIFQNNNELRASGGFMGTIGNAKLEDGAINKLDIRSVYDWDGQLAEHILPPQPIFTVNDRWFMRDSNWFANFPESAERISAMFEKEGGETPDVIIAMTPEIILDMLDRTGPIFLPQHNITLTKENFIEETQVATAINYDKKLNQPKQFLADFFPLLMEKMGSNANASGSGMMALLEVFQKNLLYKNVVIYARNKELQQKVSAFNWGGELKTTERDYISIINSNLGGTKTDREMLRSTQIQSDISIDGSITNTLTYVVQNPFGNAELNNKSFIRFYVPPGSQLVNSSGFTTDIVLPRLSEDTYVKDATVQAWQQHVSQDTVSGTFTGVESGKTWFGNWLDVPAGETKTITITYTLPFKLETIDRHSILVQKQPGSMREPITYNLNFTGRRSLWNSPSTTITEQTVTYTQELITDTFIGVVLEQRK